MASPSVACSVLQLVYPYLFTIYRDAAGRLEPESNSATGRDLDHCNDDGRRALADDDALPRVAG